jgi:hypothetical protein
VALQRYEVVEQESGVVRVRRVRRIRDAGEQGEKTVHPVQVVGIADITTGRRVLRVEDYVEELLSEKKNKRTSITQYLYTIARYLDYCSLNELLPGDPSLRPLVGMIVEEGVEQLSKHVDAETALADVWRNARETFRRLSQYLYASYKSIEDIPWTKVESAMQAAGIALPARGTVMAARRSHGRRAERWDPSWREFTEVVAHMEDARAKIAALCMYGAQIDKETLVGVRRNDIELRYRDRPATKLVPGEQRGEERLILFLPDLVFRQVRDVQEFADRDELESPWLLPSWHHARHGQHMSSRAVTQLIAHEARLQGILMTCRHIQLAGAVDSLKSSHEPMDDVLRRLGGGRWKGELRKALGERRS